MLNIFNQFLFLFACWIFFMTLASTFKILYFVLGVVACGAVSLLCYKLQIINNKSKFLFLSIGFYRHFFLIYFKNFFKAIFLIIDLAINRRVMMPTINIIKFNEENAEDNHLLIASINFCVGVFVLNATESSLVIHSIDKGFFKELNINNLKKQLRLINDDEIV